MPRMLRFALVIFLGFTAACLAAPAPYAEGFDGTSLPAGWKMQGQFAPAPGEAHDGGASLRMSRTLEKLDDATGAQGPAFAISGRVWQVSVACKAKLHSPDSSYNAQVHFEALDAAGKTLERDIIADVYGEKAWRVYTRKLTLPARTTQGRFTVTLNKTHGAFWLDALSAAPLNEDVQQSLVHRVYWQTAQLGNMLYPEDKPVVNVRMEINGTLPESSRTLRYVARDYWGAEFTAPAQAALVDAGTSNNHSVYTAALDLAAAGLQVGKYYEVHIEMAQPNQPPYRDNTTLAILPRAVTRQYSWREIPFSSRNWDNRVREYITLSDRIGIRICGIRSGWSSTPPYAADAPLVDLARQYDMGMLCSTPIPLIEHHRPGYEKYDEKALREGVRNLIQKVGDPKNMLIFLGNEPQGGAERARENIAAYRVTYDEIKKAAPEVFVIGTAVGPMEEYFAQGFGKWCDAYDFHIYESPLDVARSLNNYREMFARYGEQSGGPKPIWSTELGINSQGMTRQAITVDFIKKITTFFEAGGANASWFTIAYPDREGRITGSADDSFNVFNCKYLSYSPRLDAICYYNLVNGICIKKPVDKRDYAGGIHASLFRDRNGDALQVLWKEPGAQDVFVPLPGATDVRVIRVDGAISTLAAAGGGVTLRVSEDPLLVLYASNTDKLAAQLGEPAVRLIATSDKVVKGGACGVTLAARDAENLQLVAPPFWTVARKRTTATETGISHVEFSLLAPERTDARYADLAITQGPAGGVSALLNLRVPVAGPLALSVIPTPMKADGKRAGLRIQLRNNGAETQSVQWSAELLGQHPLAAGRYKMQAPEKIQASFVQAPQGTLSLSAGGEQALSLDIKDLDDTTLYRVRTRIKDPAGNVLIENERMIGGFIAAVRATGVTLDGKLDDPAWAQAPARVLKDANQVYLLRKDSTWGGPESLSAEIKFLWDDQHLYVGARVTDDAFIHNKANSAIWSQDGLQFLIDPGRATGDKAGKYDYAVALGANGPQAWCYVSATPRAAAGEVKEIKVTATPATSTTDGRGGMVYEIAIPWSRLIPAQPRAGGEIGMAIAINDDDGKGRGSYLGWFGDMQTKQIDAVGDVLLVDQVAP